MATAPKVGDPYGPKGGYPGDDPYGNYTAAQGGVMHAPGGDSNGGLVAEQPKEIRQGFIRKVFGILTIQLIVTSAIVAAIATSTAAQVWIYDHSYVVIIAFVLSFAFLIALACFPNVARSYPTNLALLAAFTVLEGFLVGVSAARYEPRAILLATVVTTIVVASLTAFAWQTRIDFTRFSGIAFVLIITLILLGIAASFIRIPILYYIYVGLGVCVFSFFLVIDVQLIVGGKHRKYQFGVDDYVMGALVLYIDIVNLFMFILAIVGGGGRR